MERGCNENFAFRFNSDLSGLEPLDVGMLSVQTDNGGVPGRFRAAMDVDGDGVTDLTGPDGIAYGVPGKAMMLSSITDGLGNVTSISYDEKGWLGITPTGKYTSNCSGLNWPEICLKRMTGLVTSVQASGRRTTYEYLNGRVNVAGHGWVGFDKVTSTDAFGTAISPQTARIAVTEYDPPARYTPGGIALATGDGTPPYSYPLAGRPKRVTVTQRVSDVASPLESGSGHVRRTRVENVWQVGTSSVNLPFAKLSSSTRAISDPENFASADTGAESTCVDVIVETDAYGNVRHAQTFCDGGIELTDTVTDYSEDDAAWLLSNPELITVNASNAATSPTLLQIWDPEYENGVLKSVTRSPDGPSTDYHKIEYLRDDFGNPFQITESVHSGELPRTTGIIYDADHVYPFIVTNPKMHITQSHFDERWGTPTTIVDPNGVVTTKSYDGLGLLARAEGPTGTTINTYSTSSYETSTDAGPIQVRTHLEVTRQDPEGHPTGGTSVDFDNRGRTVRTTTDGFDGAHVIVERAYDERDRLAGTTLPHLATTTPAPTTLYTYDGLDRVTLIQHSDGSYAQKFYASVDTLATDYRWFTNGVGPEDPTRALEVIASVDEAFHTDVVVTDHNGLIIRNVDGKSLEGDRLGTTYYYDGLHRLRDVEENTNLIDAATYGPWTTFRYDSYGRLTGHFDPDAGWSENTYNGYDELATTVDPAQRMRVFNHDALGRTTSILDDQGESTWVYDVGVNALGKLTSTVSPIRTTENPDGIRVDYTYEPVATRNRGLLQSTEYTIDGTTYAIGYDYDSFGRTKTIHYPDLGTGPAIAVTYNYDPSGGLTGLSQGSGTALVSLWQASDPFQGYQMQREAFGDGATTVYTYDPARHWVNDAETTQNSTQIQKLHYDRDYNGQVLHRTDAREPTVTTDYVYDQLGRLSSATTSKDGGIPNEYQYDDFGNITLNNRRTITYRPAQPHLIDHVDENSYFYDDNGRVTERIGPDIPGGHQVIHYTPFDLPLDITTGSQLTWFDYSADEERVAQRTLDGIRYFAGELYQREVAVGGTTQEERFRLYAGSRQIGEIIRTPSAGDITIFFHADHLGSVDTISSDSRSQAHQDYEPFGAPAGSEAELTRAGFTGQQHDRDLRLIDMRGRVYDPLAGRFLSPDPIMQAPFWSQGLNRYAYVFNDPINNTDPSGYRVKWYDVARVVEGVALTVAIPGGALLSTAGQMGANASWLAANIVTSVGTATAQALTNGMGYDGPMSWSPQSPNLQPTRMPGTSLFDPAAGALACNGGGDVCSEILRQQTAKQLEILEKNIDAIRELEWTLFYAEAGGWLLRGAGALIPRLVGPEVVPLLTVGPGREMLGEAISILKATPPPERAALTRELMAQIQAGATGGSWKATEMAASGGGRAWVGEYHTLVVDAAGNVFKGPNAGVTYGIVDGAPGITGWSGLKPAF